MKSRRERRLEAKKNGVPFEPLYNGGKPKSHEEMYGVGYERFNNSFVTIKEVVEEDKEK